MELPNKSADGPSRRLDVRYPINKHTTLVQCLALWIARVNRQPLDGNRG